jgi:hypothetical protein
MIAACNGKVECGENTHLEGDLCVADDPLVITKTNTIYDTTTVTVPNTITNTVFVDVPVTNTIYVDVPVTNTIYVDVPDEDLDPGHYEQPLVEIQELVGRGGALGLNGSGETHMHIAEMKFRPGNGTDWPNALFYCSYTFGVLDANNLNSMSFLAQGWKLLPRTGTRDPGCMHIAFDETDYDIVYLTHHGNLDDGLPFLSGYDLNPTRSDLTNPLKLTLAPLQMPLLQEEGVVYEGLDTEMGYIWVASHQAGLGVFERDPLTNIISRVGSYEGLTDARDVAVVSTVDDITGATTATAYVCDGPNGLVILDVSDPLDITQISQMPLEGIAVDIAVGDDNVIYIAAQTGGLQAIDVSDPLSPSLLDSVYFGASVVAVDYDLGRAYIAAWNDARIYDVTDPTDMIMLGAVRKEKQKNYSADGGDGGERPNITNRVLGVAGYGDYLFNGTWWVPYNFLLHPENTAPYIVLPEAANYFAFPGDLAIGESSTQEFVIRNDGNEPLAVFDLWSTNPAFTVEPSEILIQPGESGTVEITFTATIGAGETISTTTSGGTLTSQTGQETGMLQIWSDDPAQPVREAYLVGNPEGLSVGDPYNNDATLLDGTPWSFSTDFLGSVSIVSYFATF